ncbi:MAG: hypothetical protein GJ680_19095 [Alteromonadaceae bacterium]|nr:hypothetical protein [Alteromonadaceae bacterium]
MSGRGYKKPTTVEGRAFESISDACRHYGKNYDHVRRLVNTGMTLEEALKSKKKALSVQIPAPFSSIAALARAAGISDSTARNRLLNGWTKAQLFGKAPPPRRKKRKGEAFTLYGKSHTSIRSAISYYGANMQTVFRLKKQGKSLDEIFARYPLAQCDKLIFESKKR